MSESKLENGTRKKADSAREAEEDAAEVDASGFEDFFSQNRVIVNRYLNVVLICFAAAGPAIAIGVFFNFFQGIKYFTCFAISATMLVVALLHFLLRKRFPDSNATGQFALLALNLLLVFMAYHGVSIYLTWFLVPLLSLLYCDRTVYLTAVVFNYIMSGVATYLISPTYDNLMTNFDTPFQYFLDRFGGFTVETVIMFIAGYALGHNSLRHFQELISKHGEVMAHERKMAERMAVLDSMAEIYDNVNLINFIDSTEMSLREEEPVARKIDMENFAHTRMNRRLKDFIMPDQVEDFWIFTNIKTVRARLAQKKIISAEFIDIIHGWFRASYITVDSTLDGIPNIVIYTTRNIDEEKRREEHLIRISMTDEMTRLFNRRCYDEDIQLFREKGMDEDFVLLSVDVNGLKVANDTKGHAAGDELIKGAADCLASSVGSRGKSYRTGGDEFLAIVHTDKPEEIIEEIYKKSREWHGMYLDEISMSVGYAALKDHPGAGIDELEKAADESMYAEKQKYYAEHGKR